MDRQLRSRIHGVSGLDLVLLKIFALLVSLTAACAHTASFKDAGGAVVPDSVATDNIAAPHKKIVWFEQSAHNPPFEEPEKFNRVLIDEVLPLATAR